MCILDYVFTFVILHNIKLRLEFKPGPPEREGAPSITASTKVKLRDEL